MRQGGLSKAIKYTHSRDRNWTPVVQLIGPDVVMGEVLPQPDHHSLIHLCLLRKIHTYLEKNMQNRLVGTAPQIFHFLTFYNMGNRMAHTRYIYAFLQHDNKKSNENWPQAFFRLYLGIGCAPKESSCPWQASTVEIFASHHLIHHLFCPVSMFW